MLIAVSPALVVAVVSLLAALATGVALFLCCRQLNRLTVASEVARSQLQKTQRAVLLLQSQLQEVQKHSRKLQQQEAVLRQQAVSLESRAELIASRQQELESRDVGQMTYAHASRLASMGAGQADLISSCGLSPAEARLLELMHKRNRSAAPA